MDTKHIAEFAALAETENFWQTSGELFISQSSLSKHIQSLERELGVTLFRRTTRHVKLTAEGELFLSYARQINSLLEEYSVAASSHKEREIRRISIASTAQIASYGVITGILTDYKQQHRDCTIDVVIDSHNNLKKLLQQRSVSFIWIGESEEESCESGFVRVPFLTEPLVAVFSPKMYGNLPCPLSLVSLKDRDLIIQDNSSIEHRVFLNFCQEHGFTPRISTLPVTSIADFIKRELGIAIMLRSVAEAISDPNLSVAPIEGSPVVQVSLLYLENAVLSPAAADFLRCIRDRNLIESHTFSP